MNYLKNKTVVVPYDFSNFAKAALNTALEMAEESTSLHAIYIVEPTPTIVSADPAMPAAPSSEKERYQLAAEHMEKLFESGMYERFEGHCEIGDPGSMIVEFAKKLRADLIVIPSHGRTGLKRLFLGSVAERTMRLAHCPVFVLRGHDWQ